MWSKYVLQTLYLWFQHCMIWRIAFREGCGLTLSLLMLRERNQLENRHQQMWALLPLLIKGLLSIISQFHSFLRLIILIHFTGINHESLLNRMIKLTHRPHQYSHVMQHRTKRGLQLHTLLQYSHAMQYRSQRNLQLYTLDLELHKRSFIFKTPRQFS